MWIELDTDADVGSVKGDLQRLGLWTQSVLSEAGRPLGFWVLEHSAHVDSDAVRAVEGVARVGVGDSLHPRVDAQGGRACVVAGVTLGANAPFLLAGPCSIESEAQIFRAAEMVREAGGRFLRGGAFKPRTSPYAFHGHGIPALRWLRDAADRHDLGVVTEVLGEADVEPVAEVADILQVGARNMQNFALLAQVGAVGKPVLLKRGMAASVQEWLLAAEHLLAAGSGHVVFCERGIRGFDTVTRNVLDLASVALMRHVHQQVVIVDPSHAVGRRDLVVPMCAAALAAGADGLLVEVHPNATVARSDGPQALGRDLLADVASVVGKYAAAGRPAQATGTRS